tara:strand:+ start:278 stop:442 length:165 start_codon:yes stop_codon:yes gene_type:complete
VVVLLDLVSLVVAELEDLVLEVMELKVEMEPLEQLTEEQAVVEAKVMVVLVDRE